MKQYTLEQKRQAIQRYGEIFGLDVQTSIKVLAFQCPERLETDDFEKAACTLAAMHKMDLSASEELTALA